MPTVAVVEGVRIQFYANEHPPSHFHAVYAEFRAQIAIDDLRVMKGRLPPAKLAAVRAWAESRRDVLRRTWDIAVAQEKPEKIR